ncbi:MAG: 3-dehydroquinate synthase, partial [Alphaproteobacteria bacterium]|nr:3-dehydroquinate synthase [Alphaproteobacteria bacterium]
MKPEAPRTKVEVSLGTRSYSILVETGLLGHAGEALADYARDKRLIVISDDNVWAAQGARLAASFAEAGIEAVPIVLPPGEGSKSWSSLSALIDRLLALGIERNDHLVAFGGGVIGDLAGFAAAIVNRGCNFVQIPTTLLAQVDSSVGGKTAINVSAGKNLVGAFHQPSAVLIDPDCLDTLPPREQRAGYAEVVKYGLINDPDFFTWCEANGPALLGGHAGARQHAIVTSVSAKAAIVGEDERETSGRRALLNLGHTFGHALEAETGFSDRLLHGEAVAAGMALAFDFSVERGLCATEEAARVRAHLHAVGLPAGADAPGIEAGGKRLVEHM